MRSLKPWGVACGLLLGCGAELAGPVGGASQTAQTPIVAPSTCPDPADPAVHYISREPLACAAAFFKCDAGQRTFNDACGCGCVDEPGAADAGDVPPTAVDAGSQSDAGSPTGSCPDPADPKTHYIDTRPLKCAALLFACAPNQTSFDNACGCGCLD